MGTFGRVFDRRFARNWSSYAAQCILAASAILLTLVVLRRQNLLMAVSLAGTVFTVFTVPHKVSASPRVFVGGHFIALAVGSLGALIPAQYALVQDTIYALVVGCSMLLMAVTNTEHPPAAGTALSVIITEASIRMVLGVAVGVGILALAHHLLKPFLRDLTPAADQSKPEMRRAGGGPSHL